MFLHNYPYTLLDYSLVLHLDPLHYLPGHYTFRWWSQWMVHFLNITCLFFMLLQHLHLVLQLLQCPLQVCTHHRSHKDLNSASWYWMSFNYLCCMFHTHHHSRQSNFLFWIFMVGYLCYPSNLWSSGTPLPLYIYKHHNWSWSTTCSHFSGGLYIFLGVLVGFGICVNFFGSSWVLFEATFVIFSAILFSTRSLVASAVC